MMKKVTRANVEEHAKLMGLEPVQIDGIPEGFSFKEADVTIGGIFVEGQYLAFIPLSMWNTVNAISKEELLEEYNLSK